MYTKSKEEPEWNSLYVSTYLAYKADSVSVSDLNKLPVLLLEFMRSPCVEAGLIPPLIQLLNSIDQEVLLQTGRALGNICYDSRK